MAVMQAIRGGARAARPLMARLARPRFVPAAVGVLTFGSVLLLGSATVWAVYSAAPVGFESFWAGLVLAAGAGLTLGRLLHFRSERYVRRAVLAIVLGCALAGAWLVAACLSQVLVVMASCEIGLCVLDQLKELGSGDR